MSLILKKSQVMIRILELTMIRTLIPTQELTMMKTLMKIRILMTMKTQMTLKTLMNLMMSQTSMFCHHLKVALLTVQLKLLPEYL